METYHLFHLASVWRAPRSTLESSIFERKLRQNLPPPPTSKPTTPSILAGTDGGNVIQLSPNAPPPKDVGASTAQMDISSLVQVPTSRIRAAAAQMIFADRQSRAFISPERTAMLEGWTGCAALKALSLIDIASQVSINI